MLRRENAPITATSALAHLRRQIADVRTQILFSQAERPLPAELVVTLQHDLRTPVGNVLACATLLEMDGQLTREQAELVDIIRDACGTILLRLDHVMLPTQNTPPHSYKASDSRTPLS